MGGRRGRLPGVDRTGCVLEVGVHSPGVAVRSPGEAVRSPGEAVQG